MVKKYVIGALFLVANFSLQAYQLPIKVLSDQQVKTLKIVEAEVEHNGKNAVISKVTDGKNLFIVKQIKNPSFEKQFQLITDTVVSTMGNSLGIHVNEVAFIPSHVGDHLKTYKDRAATLHRYIVGFDLQKEHPLCLPIYFRLQQKLIKNKFGTDGEVKEQSSQGLKIITIETIGTHEDLPGIIALDTFSGNHDRNKSNMIYNKRSNCFYGIDQAMAYSMKIPSLSLIAANKFEQLYKEKYFDTCSSKVIDGLANYKKNIVQLYQVMRPSIIIDAVNGLISSLTGRDYLSEKESEYLRFVQANIEDNHTNTLHLIIVLDQITK